MVPVLSPGMQHWEPQQGVEGTLKTSKLLPEILQKNPSLVLYIHLSAACAPEFSVQFYTGLLFQGDLCQVTVKTDLSGLSPKEAAPFPKC